MSSTGFTDHPVAWQEQRHPAQFGKAIRRNELAFVARFQRYLPARCLNYLVNTGAQSETSILDVGCAAGDFYAYLTYLPAFRRVSYTGVDVSRPAIELATRHYRDDVFELIEGDEDLDGRSADIVLSIDVLLHQQRPFDHLERIVDCTNRNLILALRTRDVGETVWDPELSCQRVYDEWVPWIVINTQDLYRKILASASGPVKITCLKEYRIFGGEGRRFLPRELYYEETRSAISTLIVERCADATESEIVEFWHSRGPGMSYKKRLLLSRLGSAAGRVGIERFAAGLLCEGVTSMAEVLKHMESIMVERVDPDV